MKNYLSMLVVACSCYLISCSNKSESGHSAAAQKNLDAMRAITKSFETKDFSKLGDYIASDAVDHAGPNGDIKGLDNMKSEFEKMVADMNNQKTEIIKELADDDYAMSWARFTGEYKTDGAGHKAGDKFDMKGLEVAKFKDGKAVEHWTLMEPADVMKMMSSMPQPTMQGPADSTKKKM